MGGSFRSDLPRVRVLLEGGLGRSGRNRKGEGAAVARGAIDCDLPSVCLDDALYDGETQTDAVACAPPRLPEAVEQVLAGLGIEADPRVCDPELDGAALGRSGSDGDAPTRRR